LIIQSLLWLGFQALFHFHRITPLRWGHRQVQGIVQHEGKPRGSLGRRAHHHAQNGDV